MSDPLSLCIDELVVEYEREAVLHGVSLDVQPGASVALVGPNGAGKSTLLRAVLGLVPVASGTVQVLGRSPVEGRRDVAYVPQADVLDREFPVTVGQVVMMGRYRSIGWLRRARSSDRVAVAAALAEVGLSERADHRFGVLSGGQRQRVLLARAIAQDARLLLLDEPFNGVDATSQQLLVDVIERLRGDGVAVVLSTHDLSLAHLACSEACLLNRHVIAHGSVGDVLTSRHLAEAYGASAHSVDHGTVITAHTH